MAKRITLPSLGQSMEEGTIVRWIKSEGDSVADGELLYEVLTDKVSIEVETPMAGVLLKILEPVDAIVPIGGPIAIIGQPGESIDDASDDKPAPTQAAPAAVAPVKETVAATQQPTSTPQHKDRVNASPLARRHAAERGIDIAALVRSGSGPEGRIVKADVLAYAKSVNTAPTASATPKIQQPIQTADEYTVIPFTGVRKMVADAMTKSAANPTVTLTMPVDMTAASNLRKQLLPLIEKSHSVRISFTDIIALATSKALTEYPLINSTLVENQIRQYKSVHIGIAVSLGADGLIVPVVRNANAKGLAALSSEIKQLAGRAREGKLTPDETAGGTFTITNLGTYGVTGFNPIINPTQTAILGVCAIVDTITPIDGKPEVRPMMNLCLTFDHRITDGAPAAAFLAKVKSILENPYLLIA